MTAPIAVGRSRVRSLLRVVRSSAALLLACGAHSSYAQHFDASHCATLLSIDFTTTEDAPARITKSEYLAADAGLPELCRIEGVVAPSVGFTMALPLNGWNGKLFEQGCGGSCGTSRLFYCDEPLQRGYACIATDMGHGGSSREWLWAYQNPAALIDFGFRATHVTAVIGKALIKAFYAAPLKQSYFYGCSTGGRQAMVEAEQFPWDFDGIIAGAPIINQTGASMQLMWSTLANRQQGHEILNEDDVRLLHQKVLEQCDANDGILDGLIGDPRQCSFDPASLTCKTGQTSACLSPQKVNAARQIYAGPHRSDGTPLYAGGMALGSELSWLGAFVSANNRPAIDVSQEFWRVVASGSPAGLAFRPEQFNWDHDYQRVGLVEPLFGGSTPDLRKFKARGGKLIGFQGWNDNQIEPMSFVDFYETVIKVMGGPQHTQDFFRLFTVPGMGHCVFDGKGGGADAIDFLTYLENWTERGQAPERVIGSHVVRTAPLTHALRFPVSNDGVVDFTRPYFPYPTHTRFSGAGDPHDQLSFEPDFQQLPQ